MRRLKFVAFVSLVVAQLTGCSSCLREEEQKPAEENKAPTTLPNGKQPALSGKYRFQLYAIDGGTD